MRVKFGYTKIREEDVPRIIEFEGTIKEWKELDEIISNWEGGED